LGWLSSNEEYDDTIHHLIKFRNPAGNACVTAPTGKNQIFTSSQTPECENGGRMADLACSLRR
jgi:hypothetical protein